MEEKNLFKEAGIACVFLIVVFMLISCGDRKEISDTEGNTEFTETIAYIEMEESTDIEETTDLEESVGEETSTDMEESTNMIESSEIPDTTETEETEKLESATGDGNLPKPEEPFKPEDSTGTDPSINIENPVNSESPVEIEEVEIVPQISIEAFDLINAERVKLGLEPAVWDMECERIAFIRAEEIYALGYDIYFSDIDPHSGFKKFFVENNSLSECLAFGASNAEGVLDMWMNSEGHRTILMKDNRVYLAVVQIGDRWVAINSN